jgi:hypothetical protein
MDFEKAGGEYNLKSMFNMRFYEGKGQLDINGVDLVTKNITFESKYKTKDNFQDMLAQLIATHKKHKIPFKKYMGVFNEYFIGIIESDRININDIRLDWELLTPSNLTQEQKQMIISKIDITIAIEKFYKSEESAIEKLLKSINEGIVIAEEQKISEAEINGYAININKELHEFGVLEGDRPLFLPQFYWLLQILYSVVRIKIAKI